MKYQNAYNQAIKYLNIREHSQYELSQKLKSKGYSETIINEVLESLTKQDYQNDQRFSEILIRSRVQKGKGRLLIEREMRNYQVDEYSYLLDGIDFTALCKIIAQKKYGDTLTTNTKEKQKCIRFLTSRGFSLTDIHTIFSSSL